MDVKFKCDECGLLSDVEFEREEYAEDRTETFFRCENCSVKTICFVTNGEVIELQDEIKGIRRKGLTLDTLEYIEGLQRQVDGIVDELTQERKGELE